MQRGRHTACSLPTPPAPESRKQGAPTAAPSHPITAPTLAALSSALSQVGTCGVGAVFFRRTCPPTHIFPRPVALDSGMQFPGAAASGAGAMLAQSATDQETRRGLPSLLPDVMCSDAHLCAPPIPSVPSSPCMLSGTLCLQLGCPLALGWSSGATALQ